MKRVTLCGRAALLLLAAAALGCSQSTPAEDTPGAAQAWASSNQLRLEQAWARATPPTAKVGAGYLRIRNTSNQPARLLGASSARTSSIEIHNMSMQDGMMRMRRIEQVDIAPGQSAALAPGGDHLMLFGLNQPLVAGEEMTITLHFAGGIDKPLTLKIQRDAPS